MPTPVEIITAKRDGKALCPEAIRDFVSGYTAGRIPDYQMAALAMAIYFRGMTSTETAALTDCMLASGTTLAWPDGPPRVDKHSTGGIGDKVSIVLAPILACCGVQVPMISGRGLGTTGGTLDKLEAIRGFRTDLSIDEIRRLAEEVGCVITGATEDIAPADKKLYALRDVTGTVESIPLITASIMSKKLSEGLNALVLDVKFGSGAFMKTLDRARELAQSLVTTGRRMNVRTTALLTDMNQPLGRMAGNAVEILESVATLRGEGPADLRELTCALGAELLTSTGNARTTEEGVVRCEKTIASGAALEKFHEMVYAQGGDPGASLEVAPESLVEATREGYLEAVDGGRIGQAIVALGGGRRVITDTIDHAVGIEMQVRIGDFIQSGQPVARVFARPDDAERAAEAVRHALAIGDAPIETPPLIAERLTGGI